VAAAVVVVAVAVAAAAAAAAEGVRILQSSIYRETGSTKLARAEIATTKGEARMLIPSANGESEQTTNESLGLAPNS
jgi:ABC-type proline/glycine betaine transport system substrate-binding protein